MMKIWKSTKGMEGWLLGVLIAVVFLIVILLIILNPGGISEFIQQSVAKNFNILGGRHG